MKCLENYYCKTEMRAANSEMEKICFSNEKISVSCIDWLHWLNASAIDNEWLCVYAGRCTEFSLASCASAHFGMDDSFHLRFVFRLEKDNYRPENEFRFVSFFVCIDAPNAHWTRHYCGVMAATQNFNSIFARFLFGTGPQIGFTTISFFFFFTQFLNL